MIYPITPSEALTDPSFSDPLLDLGALLIQQITLFADVPVYDNVPQGAEPPYIVLGEAVNAMNDTDGYNGFNILYPIHVWSEYRGKAETLAIQTLIYKALHRGKFSLSGYTCIAVTQESIQVLNDPDGITRHGVQQFRILMTEN